MGRHVAGDVPELDRLVDDACAEIGREIDALGVSRLAGVVLGGGYGRGEGGVRECKAESFEEGRGKREEGRGAVDCRLSNDLDFFAITEDGVPEAETIAAIGEALKPVSEKWTMKLGVDVDFAVKTPWRLRHDEERIMVQELVRGYFDVAGKKGEDLFSGIDRIAAAKLPWMEAARLMMNRGMGLLFAKCKMENAKCKMKAEGPPDADCRMSAGDRDFAARNINKCILGVGDAFLVSRGLYRWRAEERSDALKAQGDDGLYARAVEWKFRPSETPVCDWETARAAGLDGYMEVVAAVGAGDYRRTVRNAARWVVRRRSVGELRTFARNPVVRVLESVARCVRARTSPGRSLMRDWEVFN